jgi:hypothetical protein
MINDGFVSNLGRKHLETVGNTFKKKSKKNQKYFRKNFKTKYQFFSENFKIVILKKDFRKVFQMSEISNGPYLSGV